MEIPRLPWEKYWMLLAHLTATRSTCDRGPELLFCPGRHGVGAVLVKNRRAIAGGYNGSAPGQPHCSDPSEFYACKCGSTCDPEDLYEDQDGTMMHICVECMASTPAVKKDGGHLMRDNHCVRTIHSEMNALLQCALDGVSPQGADIYCTASPCFDCAKAIIRAGIGTVYFGQAYESRYGLSSDVKDMLISSGIQVKELVITREELGE